MESKAEYKTENDKPYIAMDQNELETALAERLEKKPKDDIPEGVILDEEIQYSPGCAWQSQAWYYAHELEWSPINFCYPAVAFEILHKLPERYPISINRSEDIWMVGIEDSERQTPYAPLRFLNDIVAEATDKHIGVAAVRALLQVMDARPELISEVSRILRENFGNT